MKGISTNQSEKTRKLVVASMLSALTAILTFTPIGLIPLPPPLPNATTVHIPVLIAALAEGPLVGMAVGFVFGVCSHIHALQFGAGSLTFFFRRPLVSVLPRLLVPLVAFGIYSLLIRFVFKNDHFKKLSAAIAAVFGTVTNTVGCLGMISILYGQKLTEMVNNAISVGKTNAEYLDRAGQWLLAAVALPNGIAEAIVAAIIVPIVLLAAESVLHRGRKKA